MTPEVKERIEQIRHGNVPEGYKKLGKEIIPADWERQPFSELGTIASGLVDPREEPYCHMQHVGPENIEKDTGRVLDTQSASELGLISGKFYFDSESIVYSKIRPNLNKVCAPQFEGVCSADCYSIKPTEEIDKTYLLNLMLDYRFYKRAVECSMRTGMPKINQDDLNIITMCYPASKVEQGKIAEILTAQDQVVSQKEKLLAEKQRQKKYLMQQLLSGKKRLPGFSSEWKKIAIGSFIREVDEKTTENNQYDILSVTKNGIVRQSDHFNKQIASEDNTGYKILRRGNLAFSSMNLWMGSLDVLEDYEVGIISPAYKVFSFNTQLMNIKFGRQFMRSESMIWQYKVNSEQGASIVRRNLDLKALLSTKVSIPGLDEQQAIATVFMAADREIELLHQDIECEKKKKKALMQLLLTGIVRVAADD